MTTTTVDEVTTVASETTDEAVVEQQKHDLLVAQAKRIASLQARIKESQDEIDRLKGLILDAYPVGSYDAGDLKVSVRAGASRLDEKKFVKKYPVRENPSLYTVKPNTSAIRKAIAPVELEDVYTSGKAQVVVS